MAALVLEVADSSLGYDRNRKGSLYTRAGIPEYWIVNLQERILEVYREPREDRTAVYGASYAHRLIFEPGQSVAPLATPESLVSVEALLP